MTENVWLMLCLGLNLTVTDGVDYVLMIPRGPELYWADERDPMIKRHTFQVLNDIASCASVFHPQLQYHCAIHPAHTAAHLWVSNASYVQEAINIICADPKLKSAKLS